MYLLSLLVINITLGNHNSHICISLIKIGSTYQETVDITFPELAIEELIIVYDIESR
jgi:hypothetical protein